MNLPPLLVIIVGVIILGVVWKIVRGAIRLVLTVALLLVIAYVVLNFLR